MIFVRSFLNIRSVSCPGAAGCFLIDHVDLFVVVIRLRLFLVVGVRLGRGEGCVHEGETVAESRGDPIHLCLVFVRVQQELHVFEGKHAFGTLAEGDGHVASALGPPSVGSLWSVLVVLTRGQDVVDGGGEHDVCLDLEALKEVV